MTPEIFSIGFVVAPEVAVRALISSSTATRTTPVQYAPRCVTARGGMWLAAPMKKSIGIEKTTLVREARNARRPAAAAAGFAWPPLAAATADAMTIFWFAQIT